MEYIKNKRLLALIGIIGLFLGTVLPYYTFSLFGYKQTIALWGYIEGKIMFILILANALFIFQDYIEKYVPQLFNNAVGNIVKKADNPKFSLIPTVLVVIFAIYLTSILDVDTTYIKYGLGFYMLWLGAASLVAHAILYKGQANQTVTNVESTVSQPQVAPVQPAMVQPQMQQPAQPTMIQPQMQQPVQPTMVQPQMQQPMQPTMVQPQSVENLNEKICPRCGNKVSADSTTCFMCGNNF